MIFEPDTDAAAGPLRYEPHLSFLPESWRRLALYTVNCKSEIGGLGLVEPDGNDFVVTDVLLVEQDVNDIATRLDGAAVSRLVAGLLETGQDPGKLKFWWHSHAHEAPFWSGEDDATIERFRNDFMISLVSNHELRILARLDRYEPRSTTWVWVDKPSSGLEALPDEVAAVKAEIQAKTRHLPRGSSRIV